jgi:hypothetical protein
MRILLYDTTLYYPSSPLFLEALIELSKDRGYQYEFLDDAEYLRPLSHSMVHKLGYRLLHRRPLTYWALNRALAKKARRFKPDLVLLSKGAYVSRRSLERIKRETGAVLVNYATDDPFNPRVNSPDLLRCIPSYDLYACTKRAIMEDIRRAGCSRVAYVPFAYKPSLHFPERPSLAQEKARFCSDVVFVGGCDRDRSPYFETLLRELPRIRLHLYGGYWNHHSLLRGYHRGFAMGRDFRLALGGAKISINLVRRANRDGHVMRTFEIPACGSFMLAERTQEHLELYEEGKEAGYFGSPEELVEKVRHYLAHGSERERIAGAAHRRVTSGGHTYKDRLQQMLRIADRSVPLFTAAGDSD